MDIHLCMRQKPRVAILPWLRFFRLKSFRVEPPRSSVDSASDVPFEHDTLYTMIQMWRLRCFDSLQSLSLHNPTNGRCTKPSVHSLDHFDCAVLEGLRCLRSLEMNGYYSYHLDGLPKLLETLNLGFRGVWKAHVLSSHDISLVELPSYLRLQSLKVKKAGVLGIDLDQLSSSCRHVTIDAMFALAGVPMEDENLVKTFLRPYMEGDYVPPHILADQEAVEMSALAADKAAIYMLGFLARCSFLESISFVGDCAKSVKIIPALSGESTILSQVDFVHGVTAQASLYLFGCSGAEFLDRLMDMTAVGRLADNHLEIYVDDSGSYFRFDIELSNAIDSS